MYDKKSEEYTADFILIAKRTLDAGEYKIFSYHYLLGADFKLCCWRLKMDRGTFFHALYRIQQKLGRAFRETEPYPLFPTYEYFRDFRQPAVDSLGADLVKRRNMRVAKQVLQGSMPPMSDDRPVVTRRRIA